MVAVGKERLHTHPWMLHKSWATVAGNRGQHSIRLVIARQKVLWGRRGATGLKTFSNNLDVGLPVLGSFRGLKSQKLPYFRKDGDSSPPTRDEVFLPNFYKEARKVSRGIDINIIGTVGILILAKKKGLLSLIIDFKLSSSIMKRVLQEVGE